jgi:hypothetical protein
VLETMLDAGGEYAWRARGEEHMWTPDAIAKLQHSTRANNWNTYKEYAQIINDQSKRHMTLRGLFEFKVDPAKAIPWTRSSRPRNRQALCHRRDVAGLHLHRGPRHAGRGHEPHRRQEQHRRRRRRPARYRNELKGIPIKQGERSDRDRQGGRSRYAAPATACAPRSSRSRPAASA